MKITDMKVDLLRIDGSDLDVVNAARVSMDKTSGWEWGADPESFDITRLSERDANLIAYLARHDHWTPFAHVGAQFRVKAPIFVARQLAKHQVGMVLNEVSRRYVDSDPEFYIPNEWRVRAENVKQGSGGALMYTDNLQINLRVQQFTQRALVEYQDLLSAGVAPEQARMVLPQNTMTEWVWTGSLVAWARVCKLRLDPHAQAETREVAQHFDCLLRPAFPVSWPALMGEPK